MLSESALKEMAVNFLAAWNEQDVEKVVACYTPGVAYRDPNTRGEVQGADALRKYLSKLFQSWKMHWSLRSLYPLSDRNGAAVLWHAVIQKTGADARAEVDGMDLVLLEGGCISRNEVYFDRAVLAPLLGM